MYLADIGNWIPTTGNLLSGFLPMPRDKSSKRRETLDGEMFFGLVERRLRAARVGFEQEAVVVSLAMGPY